MTTCLMICLPPTFAEEQEGIFIEAISEVNMGKLTLDEIRTRPTTFTASGKQFTIEANGSYIMEKGLEENPLIAEDRARADARRLASEQASVHVRSISQVKNGKLTRDEIHTISVGVLQIKSETITTAIVDGATQYHCHIKVTLNDANVFAQLAETDKDKFHETVRRTIEIERESARLNAELVALKERYKTASNAERRQISAEVKRNEEQFSATQHNELALVANYQRDFDKAIEHCYEAMKIEPGSAVPWNNLGYAYTYKGDVKRAIECYRKAIELAPDDATAYINLGNVYDALKEYDTAISYYHKALELAPDYANAWNSLGYVCIQQGDFDGGIEYCGKAIALDKNYAAAWNGLGYSYNQKKKFYKAIECCRKAVGLNKNYANAWNNLGYACAKVSRHEESYAAYRNAVKIAPNVQLYRDNLAIAQKRVNSFKSL